MNNKLYVIKVKHENGSSIWLTYVLLQNRVWTARCCDFRTALLAGPFPLASVRSPSASCFLVASRAHSACYSGNGEQVCYTPITLRPRIPRIAKNWQISVFVRIRNTPITQRPRIPRISKNWEFSGFVVESLSVREVPTSFVYIRCDRFVVNHGLHESPNELRISTNA